MMKKSLLGIALAMAMSALVAAPVVVVPGSNAGYLYFPGSKGNGSGYTPSAGAGVSIDAMQIARTVCMTTSGVVPIPTGFTKGYVQAIIVGGGNSSGSASSLTHVDIGTQTAAAGGGSGGGARSNNAGGGGGGGYLGVGGRGGTYQNSIAGGGGSSGGNGGSGQMDTGGMVPGGVGQGSGYGATRGGDAGLPASVGGVGTQLANPAAIPCPAAPAAQSWNALAQSGQGGSGFGAGGGGQDGYAGQPAGQIVTVAWKYSGGTITAVIGQGGSSSNAGTGAPGVVALRFIPE